MAPLHFFTKQFSLGLLPLVSEVSSPRVNKTEQWVSLKCLCNEFNTFEIPGSSHALFCTNFLWLDEDQT